MKLVSMNLETKEIYKEKLLYNSPFVQQAIKNQFGSQAILTISDLKWLSRSYKKLIKASPQITRKQKNEEIKEVRKSIKEMVSLMKGDTQIITKIVIN